MSTADATVTSVLAKAAGTVTHFREYIPNRSDAWSNTEG
jgi:hypothetical protein